MAEHRVYESSQIMEAKRQTQLLWDQSLKQAVTEFGMDSVDIAALDPDLYARIRSRANDIVFEPFRALTPNELKS
jgi:hypothetical protein